ncbi:prophage major capsid protein [Escherichia coli]|uniref:Prophage major capsid protein n=1 Tax=Escherichia coli TaxID=562 RepID=A0A376X2C7_ECOLX|nr:prophage major capsid protein [Escherichia coli]
MIMGVDVWRMLRSFKKFRELYDLSRGSESAAELACKNLGEVVSFKGYLGDLALIVYSGKYTDSDGTEKYFLEPDLLVLGNTNNKGLVAYGAIMEQEAVRTGATQNMFYPKNWMRTAIRRLSTCRRTAHRSRFRQIFANLLPSKLVNGGILWTLHTLSYLQAVSRYPRRWYILPLMLALFRNLPR